MASSLPHHARPVGPRQLLLPFDQLGDRPVPLPGVVPSHTTASLRPRAIWQTLSAAHRATVRRTFVQMARAMLKEVHENG